jgi:hypothetical protein
MSFTVVKNISEFLSILDCEYTDEEIREFSADSGICQEEDDERVLEGFLSFRAAFVEEPSETTCWEWLLSTKQVEQRTAAWYAEGKQVLTASEISKIFKKGRTRDQVVATKAKGAEENQTTPLTQRLAVPKLETSPMDWGVRYEPLVKAHLEKTLGAKIQDLGRIRHQTQNGLAASPDGLFTACEKEPQLVGRLVEIKCPTTRVIKENAISFEYMCQMQLQMEVCDRPLCEFVEAKFREPSGEDDRNAAALDRGWITLECNIETEENRYVYHDTPSAPVCDLWAAVETYEWELIILQRVSVPRNRIWFQELQTHLVEFWKDVESARNGTWQMTPAREKKVKEPTAPKCEIVNDD